MRQSYRTYCSEIAYFLNRFNGLRRNPNFLLKISLTKNFLACIILSMAEETETVEKRINVPLSAAARRTLKILCAAWGMDQGAVLSYILENHEAGKAVEQPQ